MEQIQRFKIAYTETAVRDLEEKYDYLAIQLRDRRTAETWYTRLRRTIREDLSTFPLKFPLYDREPWNRRGVRLMTTRNDVVLYSVDEDAGIVYIRSVCTCGRDLSAHLASQES